MYNKKKMLYLGIIICIGIIVAITLVNFPKILKNKNEEDKKEQVSVQVTILEENDKTNNQNNTTNESKPLEDNKENKVDNESQIGELGVQCTLVRLDDDSDEKLESISTIFAIDKNIKTIQKEHIEKIHKTIIDGLVTESIVLNGKINSYTIDEIKETVIKSKENSMSVVRGKVNDFSYITMYISQTMDGDEIVKGLGDKYGTIGNVLDTINPNDENLFNEKLNEMIEKFNDWHGSMAITYIQTDGKTDMIDTLITLFEAMGQIENK